MNRLALEALAHKPLPAVELSEDHADDVASLARRITQVAALRGNAPLDDKASRPYEDCLPEERAAMRRAVVRVLQALVLLGYLEEQGAIVVP